MTEALVIYACIGLAMAVMMLLGAARMEVGIELLGRPVSPAFPIACTLIGALIAWPLVIWLAVIGARGTKQVVQTPADAELERRREAARGQAVAMQRSDDNG